ncbi:hypothetical protein HIM_12442 [Hirsutella minnesotensis 3608]|uniref:DUF924-domain-containing protein n=1 Tax=Hirsutella minnesotensis 3608 TaxID=1043627 RepID=A0A0F8A043_9HYPO|nr:hypothetical protein HIM_12442 [Hirsutella minnesotensis 3608]
MGSSGVQLHLSPTLLSEVSDVWFGHLTNSEDLVLPSLDQNARWFVGSDEFDRVCVGRFAPTLEAIRQSGIKTGIAIVEAAKPNDAHDWLGLVLLLDQIPRNCYRGDAAAVAFTFFDPMARDVAQVAMARGLPEGEPQLRWRIAYRQWFYLPFMHSEDLEAHEVATQAYERMRSDVYALADEADRRETMEPRQGHEQPDYRAKAAKVIGVNAARSRLLIDRKVLFEKKHMDIIKRFGRYPHRNKALGRVATVEEAEYLENGGGTFARPK